MLTEQISSSDLAADLPQWSSERRPAWRASMPLLELPSAAAFHHFIPGGGRELLGKASPAPTAGAISIRMSGIFFKFQRHLCLLGRGVSRTERCSRNSAEVQGPGEGSTLD